MKVQLYRHEDNGVQTVSNAYVVTDAGSKLFSFYFLELAWHSNQRGISCIPAGIYWVEKKVAGEDGSRFKYPHFEVLDVPGRKEIKWHRGNFHDDIRGCFLPGKNIKDIGHDKQVDVTDSAKTLQKLWDMLPKRFQLEIFDFQKP